MTHEQFVEMLRRSPSFGYERSTSLLQNIETWSKEVPVPYPNYREMLYDIAKGTWDKTGLPIEYWVRSGKHDLRPLPGDPAQILLPTDDDDWYHPDIGSKVVDAFEKSPEVDLVLWKSWILYTETSVLVPLQQGMVTSNGYAIRASAATVDLVMDHTKIKPGILRPGRRAKYIGDGLSVKIEHPASLYALCSGKFSAVSFPKKPWDVPWHAGGWQAEFINLYSHMSEMGSGVWLPGRCETDTPPEL